MVKIEYFGVLQPPNNEYLFDLEALLFEPIPALKYLRKQAKLDSFKCPAITNHLKNIYYILSPFDFTISQIGTDVIITNDRDPNIDLSPFLTIGFPEREKLNDQNMICILLQYSFINKDDNIVMEVIDPPLTTKSLTNMPGEFNISKWARSTNFCFFTDPNINKISFKRGEPLYAVRFQTTDNTVLSEITDHDRRFKVLAAQGSAANVKEWLPRLTLNECYKMFENKMKSFWN